MAGTPCNVISRSLKYDYGDGTLEAPGLMASGLAGTYERHAALGVTGKLKAGQYWADLAFPASAVNPPGAVGPPAYNMTESTWDFEDGSAQRLDVTYQWPHGWVEGSDVYFHLHVIYSLALVGNMRWSLLWRLLLDGAAAGGWNGPEILPIATPGAAIVDLLPIRHFTAAEMAGSKISDLLQVQLTRTANHADDTYDGGVVRMSSIDCHVLLDAAGSQQQFTKAAP